MDNGQDLQQAADGPYYGVAKTPQTNKRKDPDDGGDGGSQGRAKRNRYISIAWYGPLRLTVAVLPRANGYINEAMSANDERSNAMARIPANAAATCLWSAFTHQIAALVQDSKNRKSIGT